MAAQSQAFHRTPVEWSEWVKYLAAGLRSDTRWRLGVLLMGVLMARGRRTVTSWLRAARIVHKWDQYYYFISSVARKSSVLAERLMLLVAKVVQLPDVVNLVLDDSPTERYGPLVEGAGLHHNPTSGPDDHKFIYGHVWVTLALAIRHPLWHTIGLPLRALLYVKRKDMPIVQVRTGWPFRTKLELAAKLIKWAWNILVARLDRRIRIIADGAYAYRPLLKEILRLPGVTFISRLRKDAALRSLPKPRKPGARGGRRIYGTEKYSLAKRAAHRAGWMEVEATMYGGKKAIVKCKTFLATWAVVGGVIRVVIVRDDQTGKWDAFFSTDPDSAAQEILECFADRSCIEQVFHDVKEVWGSGKQQVRNVWANVGCFNLNLWMHTLVELWAWHRRASQLADRRDSPWDDETRRPSHADRRKTLRLAFIENEFFVAVGRKRIVGRIRKLFARLAAMAA